MKGSGYTATNIYFTLKIVYTRGISLGMPVKNCPNDHMELFPFNSRVHIENIKVVGKNPGLITSFSVSDGGHESSHCLKYFCSHKKKKKKTLR